MAVDRPIGFTPNPPPFAEETEQMAQNVVDIQVAEANPNVEMMDDGSALIGEQPDTIANTFDMNLAEVLDDNQLGVISSDLREAFEEDKSSRKEWEETYKKGLDLLGFKYQERSQPFQGASSVTHPMLSEAITQFQAQAYKELLPPGGPVNTQILGQITTAKEEQAQRVKDFMNYQITYNMEEYDPDLDSLLFYLPLSGSAFKKVYYDEALQRPVSKFIPSDDLYVPYQTTDFPSCERVTHVIRRTENEIRKLQVSGLYREVDLEVSTSETGLQEKEDRIAGVKKSYQQDMYQLLEMHVDLNMRTAHNLLTVQVALFILFWQNPLHNFKHKHIKNFFQQADPLIVKL